MTKLSNNYNHKISEKKWQNYWKENQINSWKDDLPKEQTFVIDTPPPTVSGLLHMGHVFSYCQADFVARFQRMNGKDVFYPIGFDDNGLPTERLVEKIIGKKAQIYEKENGAGSFVLKCRDEVEKAEKEFEELFNAIALSVDWQQKYQTISPEVQKISQASFVDLFNKGLIYRDFRPVIWDCVDQTALSQADLEDVEISSKANFINFESEDGEKIEIMTTRPELLPACVALLLNPNHFYAKKIKASKEGATGKFAYSAVFGVKVPIIVDFDVKIDEENSESNITGAVMCCTFGDENDVKWAAKYLLEPKLIINDYGKLKEGAEINLDSSIYSQVLAGKKIKQAREDFIKFLSGEIAEDSSLRAQRGNPEIYLTRSSKEIKQVKKIAERSKCEIEYVLKEQFYIKILPFKEELKAQIEKCAWHPEFMKIRALQWCENLNSDWCISRQRFFGVPIPAWISKRKGEEGKILIANINQLPCDPKTTLPEGYEAHEVEAQSDILDTWATSSISPQISARGVSSEIVFDEKRYQKLFPADLRPQAHEIIRTWAFYTIVKAYLHSGVENTPHPNPLPQGERERAAQIPWKNLMISGWCLASDKSKMSKSKGNVVTPTALIEEKGSDVVRYWASTSHLGADTAYSEEVFKIGQKLITKLFNAAKFASMTPQQVRGDNVGEMRIENVGEVRIENVGEVRIDNVGEVRIDNVGECKISEPSDIWVLSRLNQVVKKATDEFEKFEYARAREAIEDFFWNDFCDNYLEICKVRSYGIAAQKYEAVDLNEAEKLKITKQQQSAIKTLEICLNVILKLFAPFIPHICEEIYAEIFSAEFAKTKSINARGTWPKADEILFDENLLKLGSEVLKVIFEVRKFKSQQNISMKTTVEKIKINSNLDISAFVDDLKNVCNAAQIEFVASDNFVEVVLS
jgi:valyl-tRNA synthetase